VGIFPEVLYFAVACRISIYGSDTRLYIVHWNKIITQPKRGLVEKSIPLAFYPLPPSGYVRI
jgi:hypothetical protein